MKTLSFFLLRIRMLVRAVKRKLSDYVGPALICGPDRIYRPTLEISGFSGAIGGFSARRQYE